jgi:hypothetical protein
LDFFVASCPSCLRDLLGGFILGRYCLGGLPFVMVWAVLIRFPPYEV